MTIQAVFFDMGGTIETFSHSPEMRLKQTPALQKYLESKGIDLKLSDQELYRLITTGIDRYHRWSLKSLEELSPYCVWKEYILNKYPSTHQALEFIAEDLMVWIETHYYQRKMRPEIPSVLDAIQNMGYKIGLISNVNSRGQVPQNLEKYSIKEYFNPIVLSSEYGWRKPDPSIFHYAARLSNSPTGECIYIGGRISRDILGAKRAGFNLAIQIRHDFNHGESDDGATPDLIVTNMTELLKTLRLEREHTEHKLRNLKPSKHQIRAVLFDAAGVLYDRQDDSEELTSYLHKMGIQPPQEAVVKLKHFRDLASTGKITYEEYKKAGLNLCGVINPKLIAHGIHISKNENNNLRYFDGVCETLSILKEKPLYLGIITDTAQSMHVKLNKLERGGIGHFWDSIISSKEVGFKKPDPQIYRLALQQLGLEPEQAVFVGHKSSELEGARRVGIKTIAFNQDEDTIADFYIKKFSELVELSILN